MTDKENNWQFITLRKLVKSVGGLEDFRDDYRDIYSNLVLKCKCGHKDLLFKFISSKAGGYSLHEKSTEGYLRWSMDEEWDDHFVCPKCGNSIVYININELTIDLL